MTKIVRVLQIRYGAERKYATAEVQLDDGSTASVFIGGDCEVWFDHAHNKAKAFIKRTITVDNK